MMFQMGYLLMKIYIKSRGFDYNDVAPIKGVKWNFRGKINYWYNYKRKSINIKKNHDLLCWS